jgi:GH15 family glucan-1,4-alpha-glucosidase
VSYLTEDRIFVLDRRLDLVLSEDETLGGSVHETADESLRATTRYWQEWVRGLAIPFEWQEATIRAAITLQLCTFDDNGSVLAAPTTSIPEAPDSGRNWDSRYCWLQDAYFTVQAMNRLGANGAMEAYLRYLEDVVASERLLLQRSGITGSDLSERIVEACPA